jgi:hypothetical protein|tara:strand:+ start:40 stop:504 length:465 start_codon:yes stop_codon:yes gene_type:complete
MVDMKLYKAIIVSISLFLASATSSAYGKTLKETQGQIGAMPDAVIFDTSQPHYSMTQFLFRRTQFLRFSLNKEEKKMHESAVFFMLENAENGAVVSWYSKKRLVAGKVRVIHSYPISGGYCRTYQAYIKVNGKKRHMTNNACRRITGVSWSFYK